MRAAIVTEAETGIGRATAPAHAGGLDMLVNDVRIGDGDSSVPAFR